VSFSSRLAAIDRVQKSRGFKIGGSVVVGLIALGLIGWYTVGVTSGQIAAPGADGEAADAAQRVLGAVLENASSPVLISVGVAALAAVAIVAIWLGLGLTYLGLGLLALAVALPLMRFEATEVYGRLTLGVVALSASFTALIQMARLLLSGTGPVRAIARNVLAEAVRMRISVVFIVLLILGLATLPGMLDPSQPLRYRVQSFLQYSTGGTFWMLAILTLVFGITTLTSEQRTRVIWQTVTKPVSAWKYLLGKWVGIVTLQGVLLAVCATGIFLFTSYLRMQPATGEDIAFVASNGEVSEDRLMLETQVLTATRRIEPVNPYDPRDPEFLEAVDEYIAKARISDPDFAKDISVRRKVFRDLYTALVQSYRSIDPQREMGGERFLFRGLSAAKERGRPITLRYRIDAAGNRPDQFYMLTIVLPDGKVIVRRTGLGMNHTISLSPDYISDTGELDLLIYNGELMDTPNGVMISPNAATATFPPGGLQISYEASSYQMNFMRVMAVLWLKLAFLAMLAIWTSTFLSFSVASLVALSIFLMGETAGFLTKSVELYSVKNHDGEVVFWRVAVSWISARVAELFGVYAHLDPVGRLVEGELMAWSTVAYGAIVLAVVTLILYASGIAIFRKRELAIYSGGG
jgi:ABC-2 family transporter